MARKFCSDCLTFHDGECSPGALARSGKGTPKKSSAKMSKRDGATVAGSTDRINGQEPDRNDSEAGNASKVVTGGESAAPEITKEQLVDALTVSLPKAEADMLREFAAKMEANARANRERVAAHKAGISVQEYRARKAKE